ncbi:MAG: hypothetical protein GY832_03140 [Chloroflexi bacterium]|nr:hypothetical protein [Chloroflexota bacterium]
MNEHPTLGKRWGIVALLAYVGTAIAMTWPLAARLATHLPGHTTDTLVHYWNGWWVRQALSTGQSPFYTAHLFYPQGLGLAYHNFAWLNVVAGLILNPLIGGLAAYNVPFLANLALCGLAAFLLTYELTGDKRAAFLAGLIYQCWPFRLGQLDHPNLISTQWIPLFLLFLHRAARRGHWRDGVLAGVFFSLVGYTRWQQLIPAAIVGGVYLAWIALSRRILWRRGVLALLLAGVVAAVALTPPILLLMRQQRATPTDLLVAGDESSMQADLLAYLTPSPSHLMFAPLAPIGGFHQSASAYARYYADRSQGRRFPAYIGVAALALALLGVYKARRAVLPWLTMALALFLLALGPVLRVNGQLYPTIPMPYRLTNLLPVVRWLRFPDRFNMFLALPLAVLAAYGGRAVLASVQRRSKWANVVVPCLLAGVILFEYLIVPVPLQLPQSSPFYAQVAAEPGDFAILNLPINSQQSKRYMAAQAIHHRPILQGKTARFSDGTYAYLDGHPWLRGLRQFNEMLPEFSDVSIQLAALAEDGVRYIILHKTLVDDDRLARWQRYLMAAPYFEDEQIVVYSTMPDLTLAAELLPGTGVIRTVASTGCLSPGRVLAMDIGWGIVAAPDQDLDVELALVSSKGVTIQTEIFPGGSVDGMTWGYYELRAKPSLTAGDYAIQLALVDPATGVIQGQPAIVGQVHVDHTCTFDVPPDAVGANGLFGDNVRLLGYQLHHDKNQLTLTLHWRAERRMEVNYKIFVHVFDPATGVPVVQDDAMPRRNTFPTTFWWPGEIIADPIPIPSSPAMAGDYGVAIGIYDPATMERLPVMDGDGQPLPNGRFVLPGETVRVEAHE